MKIDNVKNKNEKLTFEVKDADLSFINAIRRTANEDVPVLAVDIVEFTKNDSVLYDEMLAHRIGLVPLKTNLSTLKKREVCVCKGEGCNKCLIKLTLSVKGKEVNSKDLKSSGAEPAYDMILTTLKPEQEVEFIAEAKIGTGKEHSKFVPGLVWHTYDEGKETELIVNVETWGQMPSKEILISASNVFSSKLKELGKFTSKI